MKRTMKERLQALFGKLWIKIAVATALITWLSMAVVYRLSINEAIEIKKASIQENLLDVVTVAAANLSGDMHRRALAPAPDAAAHFAAFAAEMNRFRKAVHFKEHWYTLLPNEGDSARFGIMTHPQAFSGDVHHFDNTGTVRIFEQVLREQRPSFTDVYSSPNGRWISGMAPILDSAGATVAVLEIDYPYHDYAMVEANIREDACWILLLGMVGGGLLGMLIGYMVARPIRQVSEAVHRIARNNFRGRVSIPATLRRIPDETVELLRNFNDMAGELDRTMGNLRRAKKRLETVDKAKSVFLQFMAHELRTPLNGLGGLRHLGQLQQLKPETEQLLQDVNNSAERLRKFAAAAERYITALTHSPDFGECTLLDEVVHSVVNELRPLAEQKGVGLHCAVETEALVVYGDARILEEILMPIVANALKFSKEGGKVAIYLRRVGWRAVCTVRDWGRGFVPEMAERLCEPFFVDDIEHHTQGSGVSLAIAKAYTEHYLGDLQAHSAGRGKGSTFTLSFTLALHNGRLSAPPAPVPRGSAVENEPCEQALH